MKRLLLAFFDPPWWFLVLGWPALIGATIYTAVPGSMQSFVDATPDPRLQLAVAREVRGAEQRVALEFASTVLRRIAGFIPDKNGRQDINKALAEIKTEIDAGYIPRKSADTSSAGDKPRAADKPKAEPATPDAADGAKPAKRAVRGAESKPAKPQQEDQGYGIQVSPKRGMHTNLRLLDEASVAALEAKYGSEVLPALDLSYKQRIYAEVQQRVHRFVTCILLVLLLVMSWPLFFLSKLVISVIRALSSRADQAKKVAEQNSLERQLSEARLAAMQAQIEPHFLFNTMASVQQLIETDAPAAARMQANLIKYLRGAVPQMRESTSTLGREFDLSSAYLDILKIRMEDRLSYRLELPAALAAVAFPPMMLPTLVENAIKHGLEPRTEGGEIRIAAEAANGKLRVSVADTGMGFSSQPGRGVGLTNIRERLVALYGKQAQLLIEANQPRGARAIIEIPYAGSTT